MKRFMTRKKVVALVVFLGLVAGGFYFFSFAKNNKKQIGIKSLAVLNKISGLLPIPADEKKELEVVGKLAETFTKKDDVERSFMIFLQNNMELRPGGGFLGQYAVVKIKNGEVTSTFVEDANLLDQRITTKVVPPYPFTQMMQIKRWKFRDSNFSPDFPTNVEKAGYFYRLSGRRGNFDGFAAVNATVLNDVLALTGPVAVPGYGHTFTSENAVLKLEEIVEKAYIMDPELDTQNRKAIMKKMAPIIIDKLFSLNNIPKLVDFAHKEFQKKNIMVNFSNPELQALVESVHWDGGVAEDWGGDYLMMVDANMGALKTDYYIKREITYNIDLTSEKPVVTLNILYKNTAPYGDWRTSDYHTYLRVYVPRGATLLERKMVNPVYPYTGEEFGKTFFGFKCDVVMRHQTDAMIKYELPADFPRDDYRLLIQKQSGAGDVPVKIHVKTKDGEFDQEQTLVGDLKFEFQ